MSRYFNIAGPCNPVDHYMIDASERLKAVLPLIDQKQYFVIHAARQSGKTTLLLDLTAQLNSSGRYYALYCSLEALQGVTDPKEGIPACVKSIKSALLFSKIPGIERFAASADFSDVTNVLKNELATFCHVLDKPLIIFFDEADCMSQGTLISFLRQIRNGYNTRAQAPFVHSLALVGMRNISGSLFNIVTKSLTLQNFTYEEVRDLYAQHTADTGQVFEENAVVLAFEQTQGQPWLVNAIARVVIMEILASDYSKPVTALLVDKAIQNIILRRDTHIDSLLERLNEERVKKVIEPIIIGEGSEIDKLSDDFNYVKDLGLIRDTKDTLEPANPIYGEVIIRTLSYNTQDSLQKSENP
ncbi:AAA-like domain-containing protein [bacterium A37T11]|nr:AAA-like domain-containing protein [bacterium A37T11]